ncbi:MAG: S24/S26 family peptidase [Clostridia bacterium]|nr:S24/S26 family peptidase [Clostridia bacterium]
MEFCKEANVQTRTMDEQSFLPMCREILAVGGQVPLRVTGVSMRPFLKEGRDTVWLAPLSARVRRDDVLLFVRPSGKLVLHRVMRKRRGMLQMIGDNQTEAETIDETAAVAVVQRVQRGERMLDAHSLEWIFFKTIWRWLCPVRPLIWRLHRRVKGT